MKVAPIVKALRAEHERFAAFLVHTGQHYDDEMSRVFFDQLGIPRPDVDLNVGSGSHARQTGAIMTAFEPVLLEYAPDVVLVVGDVNSTLACALVAVKLEVPVVHVEAGLRSFDRRMPEEINRVLTDQISDVLFTTEASAGDNLAREGIPSERVHFVGNVMIDTLISHRERARALNTPLAQGLQGPYALLTLHRPSNVDHPETFDRIATALAEIARDMPLVFPVHPRTRQALAASHRLETLVRSGQLRLLPPLGYLEFLGLLDGARAILTDSGGVQEEAAILGVPCLTLRETTERPVTVSHGTNIVVGTDPTRILEGWRRQRSLDRTPRIPPLWDGQAAGRIVRVLAETFAPRSRSVTA
jgi:UDP-N-acetylglucosamine 2-epimerase (non-hydrolysing)